MPLRSWFSSVSHTATSGTLVTPSVITMIPETGKRWTALETMAPPKSQGGPSYRSYSAQRPQCLPSAHFSDSFPFLPASPLGAPTPDFIDEVLPVRVSEGGQC